MRRRERSSKSRASKLKRSQSTSGPNGRKAGGTLRRHARHGRRVAGAGDARHPDAVGGVGRVRVDAAAVGVGGRVEGAGALERQAELEIGESAAGGEVDGPL